MDNNRVYKMLFSKVYPLLVNKAERKGRTKAEVDTIICWLTGYTEEKLAEQIQKMLIMKLSLKKLHKSIPMLH